MGKGQTTYPLTDEQKLTLGKQNMRAACPGQAGIQYPSSPVVTWKISTEQTYHRFFFSNSFLVQTGFGCENEHFWEFWELFFLFLSFLVFHFSFLLGFYLMDITIQIYFK